MILRLIIYLVVGAMPLLGLSAMVYFGAIKPRLREANQVKLGLLHANRTCNDPDCFEIVNPDDKDSLFVNGKWYHRHCMQKLLGT